MKFIKMYSCYSIATTVSDEFYRIEIKGKFVFDLLACLERARANDSVHIFGSLFFVTS